jgi:hypothetical protein
LKALEILTPLAISASGAAMVRGARVHNPSTPAQPLPGIVVLVAPSHLPKDASGCIQELGMVQQQGSHRTEAKQMAASANILAALFVLA